MWIFCVDLAKTGKKKPAERRAKSLNYNEWARVELNYRPHAYQAIEGKDEVRQEVFNPLTDSVICRCSPFAMPDYAGVNRQLNRQQK